MKWKSLLFASALLASLPAFAGHPELTGVARLKAETKDLNEAVQASALGSSTKSSVTSFSSDVDALATCTTTCSYALQRTRDSWKPVEASLSNSWNEYPYIYNRYVDTRAALVSLFDGGEVAGSSLSASGTMNGLAYSFASGTIEGLRNQCLTFASARSITTVDDLTVNGQILYVDSTAIERVCDAIPNYAIKK